MYADNFDRLATTATRVSSHGTAGECNYILALAQGGAYGELAKTMTRTLVQNAIEDRTPLTAHEMLADVGIAAFES